MKLEFKKAYLKTKKLEPYLNHRITNTPQWADGLSALDFFVKRIPSCSLSFWEEAFNENRISYQSKPITPDFRVTAGNQLVHSLIEAGEPEISTDIQIIHEDTSILIINKPSNLPVHPCGRYKFHSFTEIAKEAWPNLDLKPVHRLDIGTSGLLLLAKTKTAAHNLALQFKNREIKKEYLALVNPMPDWNQITCNKPISSSKHRHGKREGICHPVLDTGSNMRLEDRWSGQARNNKKLLTEMTASTHFQLLKNNNSQALLLAKPISGRTNQIRSHLEYLGLNIIGDTLYGSEERKPAVEIALHAWKLKFKLPESKKELEFTASFQSNNNLKNWLPT